MAEDGEFQRKLQLWLADDYTRVRRWVRAGKALYYNRIPTQFRPRRLLHWFGRNAIAASAPIVALFYGSIGNATAFAAAAALFGANALVGVFAPGERKQPQDEAEALVRFGDLLSALKTRTSMPRHLRDDAITASLGILEIYGKRVTKTDKEDISVSLVQYVGNSSTKLRIRHRNPGNTRPVGREFDGTGMLGHHACAGSASPRVVHDLRHFGRNLTSPTRSAVDYRSMLFIPIKPEGDSGGEVRAFVSIDCKRPYAFYGNRSSEIVVTCTPIIELIRGLLRESS